MIKDLNISNALLDIDFNEYIYEYTVSTKEDIDHLDFIYTLKEGVSINIDNNNLNDNNIVTMTVYNDEDIKIYTFYVNKELTNTVSKIDDLKDNLDIPKNELPLLKIQILTISIFIIIIGIFSILFPSKKSKT